MSVPWFARWADAARLSRFGPIVPVVPAGLNLWQAPHPFERNTGLPRTGFPFGPSPGSFPMTVCGVGVVTFLPPGTVLEHPASTAAIAMIPTSLRTGREFSRPGRSALEEGKSTLAPPTPAVP